MDRRNFLGAAMGGAAMLAGCARARAETVKGITPARAAGARKVERVGGQTLGQMRETYRFDLFDDFLPVMEKHVIDHEYGGFMCNADRDGTLLSTDKYIWYEGRGSWVYSFLYNNVAPEEKHREVARKSLEFMMKLKPEGDTLWPERYTREGQVKGEDSGRVYGDLFLAEGMAEYAAASGDQKWYDEAREIIFKCVRIYDRPDYLPEGTASMEVTGGPVLIPGARYLGHWMVLIRSGTQMLRRHPDDAEIKQIVDRSVDAIMNKHYNPRFDLALEVLNHDLSIPDNAFERYSYVGHATETYWMVMDEALRRGDEALFKAAADRFRRHVEVSWDDVYGGAMAGLHDVDANVWGLSKVLWQQEEILIGTLMLMAQSGDPWANHWFDRTNGWVRDKLVLKKHGYPLWDGSTDRIATFRPHASRIENYHHPRHLMLNLLMLDSMIAAQKA